MEFYLAVDAGGTKADYVLAENDRTLARVRGGTIKRMRATAEVAQAHLDAALEELTAQSGVPLASVACCCVGTAGNTVPLVVNWLRSALGARLRCELLVVGDVEIALDAAFAGGPGLLVLSGTGSNVAGRTPQGEILTAGGWGPLLADQASGHRIGQEGLRAAFLALDEGRPTTLLAAITDFWELSGLEEVVEYANGTPPPDFSRLAPLVAHCAIAGDHVAEQVLSSQGRELGYLVRLLIRRLRVHADDALFVPQIAFAGSVMEHFDPVRHALLQEVRREFGTVVARNGTVDPVQGALWRARRSGPST